MAIRVQFKDGFNRLCFEEFPTAFLEYREDSPQDGSPSINLQVTDVLTKKTASIFLRSTDLRGIGISLTAWQSRSDTPERLFSLIRNTSAIHSLLHLAIPIVFKHLTPEHFDFFNHTDYATHLVSSAMYQEIQHLSGKQKSPGAPGMYFDFSTSPTKIFINLKKTPRLGNGNLGKVRKVLWLNPPDANPTIAAKKVLRSDRLKHLAHLQLEIGALREFSGKRGIISLIAAGTYDDKFAIFLPFYACTLKTLSRSFLLSLNKKLNVISQWLEGLATISKKGIHGDLSLSNLYLRQEKGAVEAVIADFDCYRPYGKEKHGLTTPTAAPPEYHAEKTVTSKQDVWAMGLALHELFSVQRLGHYWFAETDEIKRWVSQLRPGWILRYPTHPHTPPFVLQLVNRMLDPRPEQRCTAQQAFEEFSAGYSSLADKSSTEDLLDPRPKQGYTAQQAPKAFPANYDSLADQFSTIDLSAKDNKRAASVAPSKPVNAMSCVIF